LRNSASEQVRAHSSSNDSGDGASAFSDWEANNDPTIVETVPEGGSNDDGQWPEGQWPEGNSHAEGFCNNARDDLSARRSDAPSEGDAVHDSGPQDLAIDTNNPGRADFVVSVGALGNASGTPLDGSQHMSFEERAVDEKCAADGDNNNEGMLVHSGSESGTSHNIPSGFDPTDPEAITALATRPPEADPRSSVTSTIRFNEQVMVTEFAPSGGPRSGDASASTGNLGGRAADPSSSLPGSGALHQHANAGGGPSSNGGPNSNDGRDSNGSNRSNDNHGGTSDGNDPQGPGPGGNDLNKLVFSCATTGGSLRHWGIEGRIPVAEVVQITGASIPQIHGVRSLMRPDTVD